MRSPQAVIREKILSRGDDSARYVDMGARLRVYRKGADDIARPAEWLPGDHGGRWDRWERRYVGPVKEWAEIKVTPGQVELMTFDKPGVMRVLMFGAPGGGKTGGIVRRAIENALDFPGRAGGCVAPTVKRLGTLWKGIVRELGPLGWIDDMRTAAQELLLANGALLQFVTAKSSSGQLGTQIQGLDWWWAVEDEQQSIDDEALQEVDFRGRTAGLRYRIYSSATNQLIPQFQARLEKYRRKPETYHIIRTSGFDNAFIRREWWEQLRGTMSGPDFDRIIDGQDLPPESRIYHAWSGEPGTGNVRPLPPPSWDITAELTARQRRNKPPALAVVGQDWGKHVNASTIFRAYRDPRQPNGPVLWFAIRELWTKRTTAGEHAAQLRLVLAEMGLPVSAVIVYGDPHKSEPDESDLSSFLEFERAGFDVHAAMKLSLIHRFSMVNTLLCSAQGVRRLFVACDPVSSIPLCPKAVESFKLYRYGSNGKPEQFNKDERDLSHYTDTVGYGLSEHEHQLGSVAVVNDDQQRNVVPFQQHNEPTRRRHGHQRSLR